jgi:hypothetical protein
LVETIRIARMARALELDDEQTVLLMRRYEEQKAAGAELSAQRGEALKEVKRAVHEEAGDQAIAAALENLRNIDRQLAEWRIAMPARLSEGFSVKQQARLYVFLAEFERQLREMIQGARSRMQRDFRPGAGVRERFQEGEGQGRLFERGRPSGREGAAPPRE